ncbi:thiamine pyrophosphate-dependent enzyme [Flavobacteriaceae bacterium]|nr:thiamine pyrophosphate-dependent enzyme [Flavobacteriaceae bacterium]MDB9967028.1 thiamine pyrophosphate-dependent enzyme [Flavobacteriaceae bacterium]MDC0117747.1 thiamine pyrophosphate-dependent enzyme [Flavobacteriaceae bacterium]
MENNIDLNKEISFETFKKQVLEDYRIIVTSREASLLGRREVLSGKAKFGIFGDGKELPQIALAKVFQNGDFRSGYYRDQTFMMAIDELNVKQLFSGLYANTDINEEPMSAGRQMGAHFNTPLLNTDGSWKKLINLKNSSSDVSCTGSQMPRLLGLAQASKLYRNLDFKNSDNFSINGNEIAWGTIGNASTSEGVFFEVLNAAGVHQVPMVISIWDDSYGISVENKDQTIKEDISEALSGFKRTSSKKGFEILTVNGWDYPNLINTYQKASDIARVEHVPVIVHVKELTQPLGHSSSGSHERYKTKERLEWEKINDCNVKMRQWIIDNSISNDDELNIIESKCKDYVRISKKDAWETYINPILKVRDEYIQILDVLFKRYKDYNLDISISELLRIKEPNKKDILSNARKVLRVLLNENSFELDSLKNWINKFSSKQSKTYSSKLYNESDTNYKSVKKVDPIYDFNNNKVDGRIIIRNNFDSLLSKYDNLIIFGEDSGKIGDVNQGLEGLQDIYGVDRVSDRGIREASIIGEGIGLALRGFRPIAEIQYLDYLLYALQILSDDLATLHYRTFGRQIAPLIIRTRGHRLEGIWHSGSPMGALLSTLRGINILVPRNMVQASGMYNSLLQCQEPAVIIESLNGYRLKENQPNNLSEFTVLIGESEKIKNGDQITLVSYGSTLRLVEKASDELDNLGVSCEIIDIQSLIPFDNSNLIIESLKKTNKLLIIDEDLPGGASSYILQKVIQERDGFQYLDSAPLTLTSKAHRPAYGTDGDYFSKPSIDDIIETAYAIMNEYDPINYPSII